MSKTCSQEATFTVVCGPICFDNGNPPAFDSTPGGPAYSFQLVPHEPPTPPFGVYHFDIVAGALPPDLTLNQNTGLISGQGTGATPQAVTPYTFTVAVSGTSCPCSKEYTIIAACNPTVSEAVPVIPDLSSFTIGTVTSDTFYFCQRTGAPKNVSFSTHLIAHFYNNFGITFALNLYDKNNNIVGNSGNNIAGAHGSDDCALGTSDGSLDPHIVPIVSCDIYHFIASLDLGGGGLNPAQCVQTLQCTIAWL